ncbi:MAG TPA: helix-hairpin-helix domain-containing protein [Thermoanaerobaculia bacterium]|nr:helix-hairpin-helix domain-containing protein [Thermoanaerobaculia bacterium]
MLFWLTVGLIPRSAKALAEAGFRSLSDLRGVTQERLLAIPGVGPASLEVLEEALGRPLPWERKRRTSPPGARAWPETVWRKRGLSAAAAITFAMEGMTLERLSSISREELCRLPGVGRKTVAVCELLTGRRIPFRKVDPGVTFWRDRGIFPRAARTLREAGIESIEDLRKVSREEVLALRGVSEITLERLEALLGEELPSSLNDDDRK